MWTRSVSFAVQFSVLTRTRGVADEDLAAMYLTDKKNGTPRSPEDHDELEVLLESFAKQVEEIVNEAENIQVSTSFPAWCFLFPLLEASYGVFAGRNSHIRRFGTEGCESRGCLCL